MKTDSADDRLGGTHFQTFSQSKESGGVILGEVSGCWEATPVLHGFSPLKGG
jgi:hypothetical protein